MTDPTITIAGLRARINSLLSAVQHSNRTTAERVTMFVEASSNADRLTAERDALAAQLTEVRAELVQLGGADLARDAAEDRAARLDADLAKVRAELAAAPKVCAIHSYALEGPCMTCGAPWPGAEKALRQERVEGMEKMRRISAAVGCPNSVEEVVEAVAAIKSDLASERARMAELEARFAAGLADRAKKLTARMAELEARPVLTHEILSAAIKKARKVPPSIARQAADEYMPHLGPVTLPAQDRAEELCRAYHERAADMDGHMVGRWQYHGPESQAICTEAMERALASLGAPPTSPTVAPPEVFAGASVEELVVQYLMAVDPGLDPGVARSMVSGPRRAGVAAVLARLKVTLVAPEFLRRIPLYTKHGPGGKGDPGICDAACVKCEAERIIARPTAGVPVTPERK